MTAATGSDGALGGSADCIHLRLYVAGETPSSMYAFANLRKFCDEYLAGRFEIEVVDLAENPSLARSDDIVAIPTLVRRVPAPLRKVIGDLSDPEGILAGLRIEPDAAR